MKNLLFLFFVFGLTEYGFAQEFSISGIVQDENGKTLSRAHLQIVETNQFTVSSGHGFFDFELKEAGEYTVISSYIGLENDTQNITITLSEPALDIKIVLSNKPEILHGVTITGTSKPDTVFGTQKVHVEDFAFLPDEKLVLLTTTNNLSRQAEIWVSNKKQEKIKSFPLNFEPKEIFKAYDETCYVIGEKSSVSVKLQNNQFLFAKIKTDQIKSEVQPIVDTLSKTFLLSDYRWYFPQFSYHKWEEGDEEMSELYTVTDEETYDLFMSEYTWLRPSQKVEARKLAQAMDLDKHEVAAFLSGFMHSMYFEELYAPAFIKNDSVIVFDHHANQIVKKHMYYNRGDSTSIDYHDKKTYHQKWEKQVLFDEEQEVFYTITSKNGFHYLRPINTANGSTQGYYKLSNKYPTHIKVKNGYVYYIYRPYGSIQKQYLYKERIL